MRIAVCVSDSGEREQLCKWIGQYCMLYNLAPETMSFAGPEEFFKANGVCHFDAVFMGFGGPDGFLYARQLRENDKSCRIIFIDDTTIYAVRSVRLHFTDFIVRPVEFKKIVRAMKLAGA